MVHFWESSNWGFVALLAVVFASLIVASLLKKAIPFLRKSLMPTSVLGGVLLLVVATIYYFASGNQVLFDTAFFGGNGSQVLEVLTYHMLALGFVASTLVTTERKVTKQRAGEVLNTGLTTVSTYLLQGLLGLGITIVASLIVPTLFPAAGVILPFGFGQGTGQALNYGTIYEETYGFGGGAHFGLTIAAMGFLSASLGGTVHLNILKKRGKIAPKTEQAEVFNASDIQSPNERPMNGSWDKLTLQIALVLVVYLAAYGVMALIGSFVGENLRSTIFGLNFLFGVLFAVVAKEILKLLNKKNVLKKQYTNNFLLTRISNFCFDTMIVCGIAVIRIDYIAQYWGIILILTAVGLICTYLYNYFVAKKLFPTYAEEQFLVMYGMLTGTASTGVILLREIDGDFQTPASENLVYQNFPAIAFGFPMMIIASIAPENPLLTLGIIALYLVVINLLLFRKQIFKKKSNATTAE